MKKALSHTRVTVKLRKSEYHNEWYLYIEAYPVFQSGRENLTSGISFCSAYIKYFLSDNQ